MPLVSWVTLYPIHWAPFTSLGLLIHFVFCIFSCTVFHCDSHHCGRDRGEHSPGGGHCYHNFRRLESGVSVAYCVCL